MSLFTFLPLSAQAASASSRRPLVLAGCVILLLGQGASAQSLFWDADADGSAGTGGTGIWDTTSELWRDGSAAGALQAWDNTTPSAAAANFSGTAGTVTIAAATSIFVNDILFGVSGYTIAGSGATSNLNLTGTDPSVSVLGSQTATISAIIASGSLVKDGTGSLLVSAVNTYSGGTTFKAGVFVLGNNNALGTGSLTFNGGAIDSSFNKSNSTVNNSANVFKDVFLVGSNQILFGNTSSDTSWNLQGGIRTFTVNANTTILRKIKLTASNASLRAASGITKEGSGTLLIDNGFSTGSKADYTGATTVNAGTLALALGSANLNNILSTSSHLVMGGGTLHGTTSQGGTNSFGQTFNGMTVNPGASTLMITNNGASNRFFNVGAIDREVGGTVNFSQPTGNANPIAANNGHITSTANTNGILGGWATVNGTDWATNNGTNIVALNAGSYTSDTWASGNNTTVTTSSAPVAASTTNSLRFNAAGANTVTLSGVNTIESGGILVTSAVGNNASTITGGTLRGAAGEDLIVIQNNTANGLTIFSNIEDNGGATGFTKSGAGTVTLSGDNTYTGKTTINGGILAITTANSIGTGEVNLRGGTFDVSAANGGAGVSLAVGQAFTGTGNVTGNLELHGDFTVGNSVGSLVFSDGLSLGSDAFSTFEFTSSAFLTNSFDLVSGGDVTFGGTLSLVFDPTVEYITESSVQIFDFGTYDGDFGNVIFSGLGENQVAQFDALTGVVTVTLVPEPGATALALGAGFLLLARHRSRRRC